ncbi:15588_t:CDS:2 [Gigaspora margarita]|uniref:15588_t:CDS:1 n=1 Tax=Gigaspora margarita TaxID=4874 RepID=A0ABN7UUR2_GIGMA|nr:15588_t:CDS:2 [Gigaspora margarita]
MRSDVVISCDYTSIGAIKRPLIANKTRWININLSSQYLKTTSACQKSQTFPNEVNQFLKKRFAEKWETLKKVGFEKHGIAENVLLELKADDLYKAGELLERFKEYTMYDKDDFHDFLKAVDGKGLESIDNNSEVPKVIRFLRHIRSNQHYRINASYLKKKTFYIQAYNDEGEPLERFEEFTMYNEYDLRDFLKANFYIQAYNDEGEPLERFEEFTMYNEDDLRDFLKAVDGKGLESIDDNSEVPKVIRSLRHIHPNQHYRINASYLKKKTFTFKPIIMKAVDGKGLESIDDNGEVPKVIRSLRHIHPNQHYRIKASHLTAVKKGVTWSKVEDQAMEEETLLAVQNALIEKINGPTKIFSKRVMFDQEGNHQWSDRVFLCEANHNMTHNHIYKLANRLKELQNKLEATSDIEFKQLLRKQYIGVSCGTKFPGDVRHAASDILGLIVVFPGGGRYNVEMPK